MHDLCYELVSSPVSPTLSSKTAAEGGDDGASTGAQERTDAVPIAYVAFGCYICGESMPWLPRPSETEACRRFDVAQVGCNKVSLNP